MRSSRSRGLAAARLGGIFVIALGAPSASADPVAVTTIPTTFFISKSENKNQVHYSVDVDEACRPAGSAPMRAYWRDLEKGPNVTSPVLGREQPAYGIKFQRILTVGDRKIVEMAVRGLPSRVVHVETRSQGGKCVADTRSVINGQTVQLLEVFLKLGFFSVDYARFIGRSATKALVSEDVKS
jgi:hypothetical protein